MSDQVQHSEKNAPCSLIDAIREIEKRDFRTVHDSGAHPIAMLLMNRLRKLAGLPSITKSDLPAHDGNSYVMPAGSNLLSNGVCDARKEDA